MRDRLPDGPGEPGASQLSVSAEARKRAGRPYKLITLAGRASDGTGRRQLREALDTHAHQHPRYLVVDLAELESIDAAVLHELVRASVVVRGLGGGLALVRPRPDVEQMLRLSGADRVIPLYGSLEEALPG